ncbi:MAG: Fic family protein [Spirochaetaceae bacterium]|nr:Fic family protein [Spirochaetaceae bacterium]
MYTPPFTVSAKTINLISEISAQLERYAIRMEQADEIRLRKVNRMKTIHGTLAIEGNTLNEEQVTALLEGKHVIAPVKEVQEVRNAIKAYDSFMSFNPYDYKDLLKAHGMMALGLVDNPGYFRHEPVGVLGNEGISHIAPPAERVPVLIDDLFEWLGKSEDHILIKSSVFHYEFEFIHPFADGNGRMGRFWQSRLLAEWNPVFAHLPIENMIWKNQAAYYKAIEDSTEKTDSGIFVDFMLEAILDALKARKVTVKVTQKVTVNQQKILDAIKENPNITQNELAEKVGIARKNIISNMKKLQENGLLTRIGADKNGWWQVME